MGFGGGIQALGSESGAHVSGTVDASLAANLPVLTDAALYVVTVAGTFSASPLISPAGSYFAVGDMLLGNATLNVWHHIDSSNPIDDTIYSRAAWDGVTHMAPSQNAVSDILATTFTAAGLTSAGTLSTFTDGYLSASTSLRAGLVTMSGVASAIQAELDTTQTSAGLMTDGSLSAFTDSYLSAATTLKGALVTHSGNLSAIQAELDTTQTSAGLMTDGTLSAFTDSYLSAATTLKGGLVTISGVASAIQAEVDAIETAVGLTTTGTLSSFSGTNYINAITNLKAAIVELDSKIMTEAIAYSIALGD